MIRLILILFFSYSFSQNSFLPNAKIEKGSTPIVMERADSLAAMRKAGHLFLQGNVKFRHDSVEFKTERASWDRNSDAVNAEGGFDFIYPRGTMKADRGSYSRRSNIAVAEGRAEARDSAGKGTFFGDIIIYNRGNEFMDIPRKPLAHYYFMEKGKLDTLTIKSKTMTYDRRNQIATVADSVLITRRDVIITGDTGFFNQKDEYLSLKGNPVCRMTDYVVKGDSMFVKLQNNEVESILVINNAHGTQVTEAKGGIPGQHSEVFGDTLFLSVESNKARSMYVNVNARGVFYEIDLPDYINKMNGDRMDISFDFGRMKLAEVKGNASSLLFNIGNDRKVDGKNTSSGESITIAFDSTKVSTIKVKGSLAAGIYYDMSKNKSKSNSNSDSKED
jgi:lipopolysaccharide export system protein LptA